MGIGAIAIQTSQKNEPSGSPFTPGSADNGLSVDGVSGNIVLGNDVAGVTAALLSNREIPMAGFSIDWTGGTSQFTNDPTVGRAVEIDTLQQPGRFMRVLNPATFANAVPFDFHVEKVLNPVPGDFNTPMKWGWNINTGVDPAVSGIHYSLEPNFRPGGARLKEAHLEVQLPNGDVSRLYSATFQEQATMATSSNLWYFSATGIEFRRLDTSAYFASFGVNLATNDWNAEFQAPNGVSGMRINGTGSSAVTLIDSLPANQQMQFRNWDQISFAAAGAAFSINNVVTPGRSVLANVFISDQATIARSGSTMTLNFENAVGSIPVFLSVDMNTGEFRQFVSGGGFFPTFYSNGVESMRIDTSQNVLINATVGTGARLHVNGDIDTSNPGAGAGKWELGTVVAAATALDATQYVEVAINGVVVKLAMVV